MLFAAFMNLRQFFIIELLFTICKLQLETAYSRLGWEVKETLLNCLSDAAT
jgi:hypothetical protein